MAKHKDRLKKRGNIWWTWFYVPIVGADGRIEKQRREASTGQRDRELACEAARRLEREAVTAIEAMANALPLVDLLADFFRACERRGRSAETLGFYRKKAKHLGRIFGPDRDVNRLGSDDSEAYADQRLAEGADRHTIMKEQGLLRTAVRYAIKRERYVGSAEWCVTVDPRGAYVPRDRALSRDEFTALRRALSEDRREYLDAFVGLGVRDSELYRIEAGDLLGKDAAKLTVMGTKTAGAERVIPVPATLRTTLLKRAQSTPVGPLFPRWGNVNRDLRIGCKHASIPRVSPNDLRRTTATWLAESGAPEIVIVQVLGHKSSTMVRRVYARISVSAKDAAMQAITVGSIESAADHEAAAE